MNDSICPKDQLSQLIGDSLDIVTAEGVIEHLETCPACQTELESLSADASWWKRAKLGLVNAATDEIGRLLELKTPPCAIDSLLEGDTNGLNAISAQAVFDTMDPPSHPEMLGRIDEFEIEEKIGQGGMGVVFRGFDRSLNRPVAIKVMAPHLGSNGVARQRFEREARAAAAVVHPNVIPIYRVSTTNKERPYIAMALADGLSLQEYVHQHGPFDVKDVVRISIQIASGLKESHKQGLIHRDIKPANVLMEKDVSRIMITDFGLARAVDDVMMTQSGCLAGTPNYMSPEQVVGDELDHRSDLFSLGSLMYFIATGREPFRAESAFAVINNITRKVPKSAQMVNADIPDVLNRIIERLHEKRREDRIESAEKLEQVLTNLLAHLQEPNQHGLPRVRATTNERRLVRQRVGWGIAFGGFFLGVCLYAFGFLGPLLGGTNRNHSDSRHHDADEHLQEHKSVESNGREADKTTHD